MTETHIFRPHEPVIAKLYTLEIAVELVQDFMRELTASGFRRIPGHPPLGKLSVLAEEDIRGTYLYGEIVLPGGARHTADDFSDDPERILKALWEADAPQLHRYYGGLTSPVIHIDFTRNPEESATVTLVGHRSLREWLLRREPRYITTAELHVHDGDDLPRALQEYVLPVL